MVFGDALLLPVLQEAEFLVGGGLNRDVGFDAPGVVLFGVHVAVDKLDHRDRGAVFIVVCANTAVSKLVYEFISGFQRKNEDGELYTVHKGHLELFRNFDDYGNRLPKPNTLLIDSEQIEADEALADHLLDVGVPAFLDEWLAQPLFAGLTPATACRDERLANVDDAFVARGTLAVSCALVVDDVCTTGATLSACAAALHQAGVGRVVALTFARAVHRPPL
mgnify:CR=1 FL=1